MRRAQLPLAEHRRDRTGQPAQNVDLVDRLVDQGASALGLPTPLDGSRIVFGRAVPLHVTVALEQFAQAACRHRTRQEQAGVVEPVLAHHAQEDAPAVRRLDHAARGFQVGRNGLLHLHVLPGLGTDFDGFHAEIRERAYVHIVHVGVAAHLFVGADELRAVLVGELASRRFVDVRAHRQLVSDVFVGPRVHVRNGAGADHSDSHMDNDHFTGYEALPHTPRLRLQ